MTIFHELFEFFFLFHAPIPLHAGQTVFTGAKVD